MTYIDGFVLAVPAGNRDKFIAHASMADAAFLEVGATRVVECWQADVQRGHTTDFFGAVDAKNDEAVAFSWIEWPDKATRDAGLARTGEMMKTDPRLDPEKNPMPFDGKRMIFGGFVPIVEDGSPVPGGFMQGFIVPVPQAKKDAYREVAAQVWEIMKDYGASRVIEAWQDDVPRGQQTDFYRAVKAEEGEAVVFSFIEWPSKAVCDAASEKMMADERMDTPEGFEMPFDGKRMVYGGFEPVVEVGE